MLGIPPARDMAELGKNNTYNGNALRLATCKAIFEAADSVTNGDTSVTTAAITKSNTTAFVEELYTELGQSGYTVTNGTTTFTVTWGL